MAGIKIDLSVHKDSVLDFNKAVKAAVETVAKNNPCRIRLKLDTTKGQANNLQRQISSAVTQAAQDRPFKIKTVTVDQFDIRNATANLQDKLDKSPMKLTIKSIDATSAINTLKKDLTAMLKGLRIEGVGEFVGSFADGADIGATIDQLNKMAEAQARAREATAKTDNALHEMANAYKALDDAEKRARKLKDDGAREDALLQAKQIRAELASAAGHIGDELIRGVNAASIKASNLLSSLGKKMSEQAASSSAFDIRESELKQIRSRAEKMLTKAVNGGDQDMVAQLQGYIDNINLALTALDNVQLFDFAKSDFEQFERDTASAIQRSKELDKVSDKLDKLIESSGKMPDVWSNIKHADSADGAINLVNNLNEAYKELQQTLARADAAQGDEKVGLFKDAKKQADDIRRMVAEAKHLDGILTKLDNAPEALWEQMAKVKDADTFNMLEGQVAGFISRLNNLSSTPMDNLGDAANQLVADFNSLKSTIADSITLDAIGVKADHINTTISGLDQQEAAVTALKLRYDTLRASINAAYNEQDPTKRAQAIASINNEAGAIGTLADKYEEIARLKRTIDNIEKNSPSLFQTHGKTFGDLREQLGNLDIDEASLDKIRKFLKEFDSIQKGSGGKSKGFWEELSSSFNKFSALSLVDKAIDKAYDGIMKMFDAVKNLDAAMTELRKVTDLTEMEYQNFYKTASQMSGQVGATISDTINATADFARVGYTIGEATQLAEAAIIYKNVGDGISSITQASESMISTIKAFGLEVSDAQHVVDAFNQVGNNFAISSTGIGDALQRSAAALAAAGNTMEESIGLVTGMNTILQNPESVGESLRPAA